MRSSAELVCIDPRRAAEVWPHVGPLLRRAIERAGLTLFADIERDVLYGGALVWLAWSDRIEAAAATALVKTDAGLVCVITACGGIDRARWLPLLAGIEDYARAEGCKSVRLVGRRGWQRALRGYGLKAVVLEKELN
jgi:hypothetical protein